MTYTVNATIELAPGAEPKLDALAEQLGLSSKRDLFVPALELLHWAVEEVRKGKAIASYDRANKEATVVTLPVFTHIQAA